MEQSALSHQLRILREHGLIANERHGRRRIYSLEDEHVADFFQAALRHVGQGHEPERRRRRAGGSPA
jgi:DNA-binding transcriptional ArsR family regulator